MDLINKYLQEQTPGHEYEYDYEGDMAKTQLNMMIDASMELKSMLANDTNLPEWVQSKITKAADYIDSARDYMKNMNKDTNSNMHNEPMGEEAIDTGWKKAQTDRKDEYGNRVKNVARRLARQGMQAAMKDLKKGPEAGKRQVEEVEELDEALRHKIAGAVGQFIGNKIDPVHGQIMQKHGEEAYRQAAYHIRKTISDVKDAVSSLHDRLHKQLRTGGLATEEVELDELKEPTVQKYITRAKFSSNPKRRAMAQKAQSKLQQKPNPMKTEEVEELDEISQELATKAYAKRSGTMSHDDPVARKKEDDAYERIGKRWGKKGQEKADAAADKYNEEVELDESLKNKLAAMGVAATMAASPAAARVSDGGQSFAQQTAQQSSQSQSVKAPKEIPSKSYLQNVASGKSRSLMHPDTAKELLKKHYSEEVDLVSKYSKLGEAKYPGFRVRTTSGYPNLGPKLPRRGYGYVPQGDTDPRTGLPLGFSHPPKKDEPKKPKNS